MPETITARDANHHFSRVLREVAAGKEFVVTRGGTPVARIIPEPSSDGTRTLTADQQAALASMLALFRTATWGPIEHLSREQLYDEVIDQRIPHLRDR